MRAEAWTREAPFYFSCKTRASLAGVNIKLTCMLPANPSSDPAQQRLTQLRNGLLTLHKTLLDSERASYERDIARISSSGELLNLDRALLWSEPLARGWNVYLAAVRTGLPTSRKLR